MGKINNQERITWKNCIYLRIHLLKIGSFSIDDGDGIENATFKMDYRISNFVAFIPIRWKCLMWANFPEVDFLGTALKFKKRKKIRRRLFTSPIEREIRYFHVVVVQWRQRNVQKSVMHDVQTCCFA